MKKAKELPSQEDLLKLFYYDDCLRWRVDIRRGKRDVKAGDEVIGWDIGNGYSRITINNKTYLLSRITYQTVHGNLTNDLVIDHINRDPGDNKIENLRKVSQKHNNRNYGKRSNNSSGANGVSLDVRKRQKSDGTYVTYLRYIARWRCSNGKQRDKCFSISKYGKEGAFRLACEYRNKMIQQLIDDGEWYDPKHGI